MTKLVPAHLILGGNTKKATEFSSWAWKRHKERKFTYQKVCAFIWRRWKGKDICKNSWYYFLRNTIFTNGCTLNI